MHFAKIRGKLQAEKSYPNPIASFPAGSLGQPIAQCDASDLPKEEMASVSGGLLVMSLEIN